MIKKLIGLAVFLVILFLVPQKWANHMRLFAASTVSTFSSTNLSVNDSGLIPARVVFREPVNWSSSFWIGVGEGLVKEGCPVVVGNKVVGIVEEVGASRSKVRLITDQRLSVSVQAVRGGQQNRFVASQLQETMEILSDRTDLGGAKEMTHVMNAFLESIDLEEKDHYLAKGEIRGASRPLWRILGDRLKGIGFHYYFADEKGPARKLESDPPLIQVGDLLVTTGMDGLFPPDLQVGVVTKVFPLREGETTFSIEAKACVQNISDLKDVFVLNTF